MSELGASLHRGRDLHGVNAWCLAPTSSFYFSLPSAHSNRDSDEGLGLPLRPADCAGSSARNSAHEERDCCGSEGSSQWPLPRTGTTVGPLPPYPVGGRPLAPLSAHHHSDGIPAHPSTEREVTPGLHHS